MFRAGEPTTIKPDSDRFSIYCLMVYVIWRRYTGSTPTLFEEKQSTTGFIEIELVSCKP